RYTINYYLFPIKKSEGYVKNNLKEGIWKYYYSDGKVSSIVTYSKGVRNGRSQQFYQNGKLSSDVFYQNGNFYGTVKNFYLNGNLNTEEYYDKNHVDQGPFKIWFESGKLSETGSTINGKIVGKCILYHENGNVKEIRFYDSLGRKDSVWSYYSPTGTLIKKEEYNQDSLISPNFKMVKI
ncbi:MAG: toxin-antitoxin system YwqK family antitoxin, partial [Ginsengibacter sp.]